MKVKIQERLGLPSLTAKIMAVSLSHPGTTLTSLSCFLHLQPRVRSGPHGQELLVFWTEFRRAHIVCSKSGI